MVCGFWGQNIGNAFFNLGGQYQLSAALGSDIFLIQDAPAYWTLHRKKSGNYANWFDTIANVDLDLLVLQGPLLTEYVDAIWSKTAAELRRRGTRIGLLGVGHFRYTAAEKRAAAAFISAIDPIFISTRDFETYQLVMDVYGGPLLNGIDSAFFLNRTYHPPVARELYGCLNFDLRPEPRVTIPDEVRAVTDGSEVHLEFPRYLDWLSSKSQWLAYALSPLKRGRTNSVAGVPLVRTDHRSNPHLPFRTYAYPNSVVSDEPYTYLNLYSGAEFVVTDRVHATVACLGYGTPVCFAGTTPRSALLDRVGYPSSGVFSTIDLSYLSAEQDAQLEFLRAQLGT